MMYFKKPDNVFFNCKDLETAIKSKTTKPKEKYRIVVRNGYPTVCIGHERYYIHRLLGELYYGNLLGYSIHHKDEDKMNATKENLEKITNKEHTILHHKGKDYRTESGIKASVSAMAKSRRRSDVSPIEVKKAREDGLTYKQLCIKFKCGNSVIKRCLDWSKENERN